MLLTRTKGTVMPTSAENNMRVTTSQYETISDFPQSIDPLNLITMSSLSPTLISSTSSNVPMTQAIPGLNLPFIQASDISDSLPKSNNKSYVMCAWIISNHPRPDHAPVVIVIQSEQLNHSISPRNQSAKHPESGCFSTSRVVIGSALTKRWRQRLFARSFFLTLDRNRKPRMKSLWHPGQQISW